MRLPIFAELGSQLQRARRDRGLTQPQVASRVGRDPARISELERDLRRGRLGRDRLTLVAEICDALDLIPVLVPAAQAARFRALAWPSPEIGALPLPRSTFDDVFVDLGGEDEGDDRGQG